MNGICLSKNSMSSGSSLGHPLFCMLLAEPQLGKHFRMDLKNIFRAIKGSTLASFTAFMRLKF